MLDWMIHHFRKWADYNSGVIIRLYDAYAVLSDAELQRDRKESFNSVCGTLNQILVGGRIAPARSMAAGDALSVREHVLQATT